MIPKKLKKDPLIEAIWELRFDDSENLGEILLGIVISSLRLKEINFSIEKLPAHYIPEEVKKIDPVLKYMPKMRIKATGKPFIWQIGEKVFTFNNIKPYTGWMVFSEEIKFWISLFTDQKLFNKIDKFALRYINLIPAEIIKSLEELKVKIKFGNRTIKEERINFALEKKEDIFKITIQISRPISVLISGDFLLGTLVDIEITLENLEEPLKEICKKYLDRMHDKVKHLLFEEILAEKTIKLLQPEQ